MEAVYLLILAAVILLIAAAVRSRDLGKKDSAAAGGKKPGKTSGTGGQIFVDPILEPGKRPEEKADEPYTFLYQYSPRRDLWICGCCEAENQMNDDRCQVCGKDRN